MISYHVQQAEKHTETNHNINAFTLTSPKFCEPTQIYLIITNIPKEIQTYQKTCTQYNNIPQHITKYTILYPYIILHVCLTINYHNLKYSFKKTIIIHTNSYPKIPTELMSRRPGQSQP